MDKKEQAKSFLEGILRFVAPEQKDVVQSALLGLVDVEDAAEHVASHILRQEDYSREMNDLKTKQEQLDSLTEQNNQWYRDNSSALSATAQLAKDGKLVLKDGKWQLAATGNGNGDPNPNPNPNPNPDPTKGYITEESLKVHMQKLAAEALPVMEQYAGLGAKHMQIFNEPLGPEDLQAIRQNAEKKQLTLDASYREMYKPKYDERQKKQHDDELASAEKRGYEKARAENPNLPHVFSGQAPSSHLDVLTADDAATKTAADESSPDALAAKYMQKLAEADPNDASWWG
jgi:hypothetical protein